MKNTQKNRKKHVYIFIICINILLTIILILFPKNEPLEQNNYYSQDDYIPDTNRNNTVTIPDKNTGSDNTSSKPVITETRQIAIVIDDVGYNLNNLDYFLEFPGPITFAVLPHLPYSKEAAAKIVLFVSVNIWLVLGYRGKRLEIKKNRLYNDIAQGTLPIGIGAAIAISFILLIFILS